MSDVVKRLHRQAILIGMVGGDKDLKSMLEKAAAEIALLRESMAIFVHAHADGNYVRSSHEAAARALLKEVPRG